MVFSMEIILLYKCICWIEKLHFCRLGLIYMWECVCVWEKPMRWICKRSLVLHFMLVCVIYSILHTNIKRMCNLLLDFILLYAFIVKFFSFFSHSSLRLFHICSYLGLHVLCTKYSRFNFDVYIFISTSKECL